MKKRSIKAVIGLLLVVAMVSAFCLSGISSLAKEENHGTCGDNVRWYLDESTHMLNILGEGKMYDYVVSPWKNMQVNSVVIGEGITSVGENAFADCEKIEKVNIASGVTDILSGAFAGCRSLKNINIPETVTVLEGGVFEDCVMLNYTEYGNCCYLGNTSNKYRVLVSATSDTVPSVTIHPSTVIIGDGAFADCEKLTSVTIPDSVIRINDSAFNRCLKLTSVVMSSNLQYLGSYVFEDCKVLQGTSYMKGISYLRNKSGDWVVAYKADSNVSEVKIINTVKFIYDRLLYNRYDVTKLECTPETWISIGRQAFEGCGAISNLTISKDCTRIGYRAFANCENLENLTVLNGVRKIENGAFMGCTGLKTVYLGNKIEKIENNAFSNLNSLSEVKFVGTEDDYKNINILAENNSLNGKVVFDQSYECTHTATALSAQVGATCCSDGHQADTYCTICGQLIKKGDVIKAKAHASYTWKTVENATATVDGLKERYCADCGMYEYEIIPKTMKGVLNVTSSKGCAGSNITVKVSVTQNPGIVSMALKLEFDQSVLELVSADDSGILGVTNHQTSNYPYRFSWENDTLTKDITATGDVLTLVFKIKDGVSVGTKTDVKLSYNFDNSDIVSAKLISREFTVNNGTVEVIAKVKGDADSDGAFTAADRVLVSRYLANWDGYDVLINMENADVDGDGKVTSIDRIMMSRKLAGWPDTNFVVIQ